MEIFYISLLSLLGLTVLLYVYVGVKGIRKQKKSTISFLLGILIGSLYGFLVFYLLHVTSGTRSFQHIFQWWRIFTIIAVLLGGLTSLYLYIKITKK